MLPFEGDLLSKGGDPCDCRKGKKIYKGKHIFVRLKTIVDILSSIVPIINLNLNSLQNIQFQILIDR